MMPFQAGDVRLGDAHAGKKENLETVLVSRFSLPPHFGLPLPPVQRLAGDDAFGLPLPPVQLSFCISRRRREMMRFSRREMYDWEMPMRAKKKTLKPYWFQGFLFCPHGRGGLRPAFAACSAELLHLPPQTGDDALFQAGDVRLGDAHAGKKENLETVLVSRFSLPTWLAWRPSACLCRLFS